MLIIFSFLFFLQLFNISSHIYMLVTFVQKPYHINDTAVVFVFLLSQSMFCFTICFMYVPYLLFNYILYIFVHIFTGVEILCVFVYHLLSDISCVFICNLDIFDNG
jgi:hypothetical protein